MVGLGLVAVGLARVSTAETRRRVHRPQPTQRHGQTAVWHRGHGHAAEGNICVYCEGGPRRVATLPAVATPDGEERDMLGQATSEVFRPWLFLACVTMASSTSPRAPRSSRRSRRARLPPSGYAAARSWRAAAILA